MHSNRRKRRQAQRRLKRDVMQNHMVLRGWEPVMVGPLYGLAHTDRGWLVLRKFFHKSSAGAAGWGLSTMYIGAQQGEIVQCSWNDLQAQWVRNMRSLLIQRGWV